MSSWPKRTLDELGFVGRGRSRHRPRDAAFLYGGDTPFFQTGDVKATDFWLRNFSQTYSEAGLAQSKLWPPGTLCITIAANIAESAVLAIPGAFPDSVVGFIPHADRADVGFVKYALDTLRVRMQRISQGTTQDNLSLEKLLSFKFPAPAIEEQQRIAGILSAYDDLIENCERRIRVLDEMARSLYREWFVDFRFFSFEEHRGGGGPQIPSRWEATTLGSQLVALESGKRPKGGIRDVDDGVPSIGAENIDGIGRHGFESEKLVPRSFFQAMRKGVVCDRDVAVYKDGAYIGKSSFFRDGFPHAECCVNEHVFLLRANGRRLTQNALYLWLQQPETVHAIRAMNANAAQPGINQTTLGGLEVMVPDEALASRFDAVVEPMLAQIISLAKRIKNLRATRDLLLPRLISGQLSVDHAA